MLREQPRGSGLAPPSSAVTPPSWRPPILRPSRIGLGVPLAVTVLSKGEIVCSPSIRLRLMFFGRFSRGTGSSSRTVLYQCGATAARRQHGGRWTRPRLWCRRRRLHVHWINLRLHPYHRPPQQTRRPCGHRLVAARHQPPQFCRHRVVTRSSQSKRQHLQQCVHGQRGCHLRS